MKFINRNKELKQLERLSDSEGGGMAVLWGRRRVGKTRLLLEWSHRRNGLYLACDESAPAIQRKYFAERIAERFPGFNEVDYPDWPSLLNRLSKEAKRQAWNGPLIIDELPYLVVSAKEIASVLQRWVDHEAKDARLTLALSGSSQRMMQGIVLDRSAPLFGRAAVAMRIMPLLIGCLPEIFNLRHGLHTVMAYSVWGGIPRYWELAGEYGADLLAAVDALLLNPLGALHDELDTLLLEEIPPANALRPLLDAIGLGANRPSEIAGRLGQPVTSLSRPLGHLVDMGIVRREVPFGESENSSKRVLYKIADPLTRLWFAVIAPNRSLLMEAAKQVRQKVWISRKDGIFSMTWEDLCRASVCRLTPECALSALGPWKPAARFWKGNGPEWDLVSISLDKKHLLLGEVKWTESVVKSSDIERIFYQLKKKGIPSLKGAEGLKIIYAVFIPRHDRIGSLPANSFVVDADEIVAALSEDEH
jgi:hypothetical protein